MRRALPWWLLLGAAALLRLFALGREGLWVDEAYTVGLIRGGWGEILGRLKLDDAPPFFYFLEKITSALAGRSEWALRLLPALAGISVVALLGIIVKRVDRRALWLALGLAASSSLLLFYSRQARSYSLLQLEAMLLLWQCWEARATLSSRRAIGIACLSLATLYTHNLGLWPVAATLLCLAPKIRSSSERRSLLILAGLTAAGALPWMLQLHGQLDVHRELNAWMGRYWEHRPFALAPLFSLLAFVNGGVTLTHAPVFVGGTGSAYSWSALLLAIAIGAVLIVGTRNLLRANDGAERRELLKRAGLFLLLPLVGLWLSTAIAGPAYVLARTDTAALPAFLLILALALASLRSVVRWAVLVLWAALGIASLGPSWTGTAEMSKGSDRELARRIGAALGPRDAVVLSTLTRPSLEYYAERQGWLGRVAWFGGFPRWIDDNPAATYPSPADSLASWQAEALALRAELERRGVERAWVLGLREAQALSLRSSWPRRPSTPPAERRELGAGSIQFPTNVMVATLAGLRPVRSVLEYQQDWVTGERLLLEIPAASWAPVDSLPRIEMRP